MELVVAIAAIAAAQIPMVMKMFNAAVATAVRKSFIVHLASGPVAPAPFLFIAGTILA